MKWLNNAAVLVLIATSGLFAQTADSVNINRKGLKRAVAGSTAVYATGLYGLNRVWYDSSRGDFHWFDDNHEWKQIDKIGHFYSSFHLASGFSRGLQHYNVPERKADLIGAICGFAVMIPVEIMDGYSPKYGASAGDLVADAAGPVLYLLEKRLWNEVRIHPKFSFHRTDYARRRPEVLGAGWQELIKDYNGQTYWLSADMDKFIRFPRWLNLAVGYGAEGMVYARDWQNTEAGLPAPYRQFYIGLDWDLTAIRTNSRFVKTLLYFGNMIRFPAPAVALSGKGASFRIFYY